VRRPAGELDPDEDKENDSTDDGQGVRVVDAAGDGDASAAGRDREAGVAGTLSRQHGERSATFCRHRTGIPATDAVRRAAPTRPTAR